MNKTQALEKIEAQPLVAHESESSKMFSMIERMATDPQCDPAKLREILSVKQNWEADEARKAFAVDMANFQARCPIIEKADSANGKNYARIDRIHRQTRPLRTECGFWFIWNSAEIKQGIAYIDGILGHRGGHTVLCKQVIPLPDEIVSRDGKKVTNEAQRAGSGMTYAKRYGECLALGIVTGEDDDGNRGKGPKPAINSTEPTTKMPTGAADEHKALRADLWTLLGPTRRGKLQSWDMANEWLWKEEILDAANPDDRMPDIGIERLKKVIEATKKKLA